MAATAAAASLPEPKDHTVRMFPITEQLPADVHPARLDAGDVIEVPGRGRLTLASQGGVWTSAKPTWMRFKVVGGKPFDVDSKEKVRLIAVGTPAAPAKPAAAAPKPAVPKPGSRPPAGGREVPLNEVTWGMYGWIKAMGPDGSATIETGYVTRRPRVYTGGLMSKPKLKDQPILHFNMVDPGRVHIGMNALLDATFVVLDPPKDRPLREKPSDSGRMPVRDARAGDLVGVTFPAEDRHFGRHGPEVELTEDPEVSGGYCKLTGTVAGGPVETFTMRGEVWVNVEGPAVRHLVDQDPAAKTTTDTGWRRDLPAPGETEPDARWRLLGVVSTTSGTQVGRARRERMWAAMRRVHGLAEDASLDEIKAARDADDCGWGVKCEAYWRAYAALMHEEGAARTAAAEPFPAGEPAVGGEVPGPRNLIPVERWWMLEVVSRIYGSEAARARRERMLAAMRRVHDLPADASVEQIEAARDADERRYPKLCWDYWDAYAVLLAEEGAARTIKEEPMPAKPAAPAAEQTDAPAPAPARAARPARKRKPAKREIPLTEVTWGTYGEVKGFHPDGSRYTGKGYLTLLPRIYTGGIGEKSKFKGEELLHFTLHEPSRPGSTGGCTVMMSALPGDTFTLLDPPADRPLNLEPTDRRRMPVVDLRADDIIPPQYHGDKQPEMYLLEDPKPLGQGRFELTVTVNGVVEKRRMNGDSWVTVDGPALRRAQAAPAAEQAPEPEAQPADRGPVPAGAFIHCPRQGCGRKARVRKDWRIGAHSGCDLAGTLLAPDVKVQVPPPAAEPLFDLDAMAGLFGEIGEELAARPPVKVGETYTVKPHVLPHGVKCGTWHCLVLGDVRDGKVVVQEIKLKDGKWRRGMSTLVMADALEPLGVQVHIGTTAEPEPAPVNAGQVLDDLRAKVDTPGYGRVGREAAQAHAERYAAGLPLIRHKRALNRQWEVVCPVPACLLILDGHDTVRAARDGWLAHAAEHEGFTATWPDDVLPVEPEQEEAKPKRRKAAEGRKRGPKPAAIEIVEPVGNDWWDDSALAWEKAGLLHRATRDYADGPRDVAVLSMPLGYAKAVEFEALLASVGGIDPDAMVAYELDEQQEPDRHDPESSWSRLSQEAGQIVADCRLGVDRAKVVWAMGVTYVSGTSVLQRYFDSGRQASALFGGLYGIGNVGKPGRGHWADLVKIEVYQDTYTTGPTADREALASVTWPEIADLVETALGADEQLTGRLVAAEEARLAAEAAKDGAAGRAARDVGEQLVAQLWESVRPVDRLAAAEPAPMLEFEVLTLLDMEGIGKAVAEALATV